MGEDCNKALLEAIIRQNETILKLELNILNISTIYFSTRASGNKRLDEEIRKIIKTQADEAGESLKVLRKDLEDLSKKYKGV